MLQKWARNLDLGKAVRAVSFARGKKKKKEKENQTKQTKSRVPVPRTDYSRCWSPKLQGYWVGHGLAELWRAVPFFYPPSPFICAVQVNIVC